MSRMAGRGPHPPAPSPSQAIEREWIPAFAGMTGAAARSPIAPDTVSLVLLYLKPALAPHLRRRRHDDDRTAIG